MTDDGRKALRKQLNEKHGVSLQYLADNPIHHNEKTDDTEKKLPPDTIVPKTIEFTFTNETTMKVPYDKQFAQDFLKEYGEQVTNWEVS